MKDSSSIFTGLAATLLLHLFIVGGVVSKGANEGCGGGGGVASATDFGQAETIEASLAFKEVKPKTKQPQKKKKQKFKPTPEDGASKDETKTPEKEPEKEKIPVEPDEIDIASILEKNRKQDEDLSDTGSDEVPVEGAADGSADWGTETEARGDPYVGELKGRIYSVWKVPALETGSGQAIGCVRLKEDGEILDRELKKRSKNTNLDRSVEVALKTAPNMEEPVPDKLKTLLTVKGICFNFEL